MTTDLHAYEAVCVQGGAVFCYYCITHLLEPTQFFKHCDYTYIYIYIYIYGVPYICMN